MKRIAMLGALLTFFAFSVFAQDNSTSTTTTTTTTTQNDNSSAHDTDSQATTTTTPSNDQENANRKARAQSDEAAADQHKDNAKQADTSLEKAKEKSMARLDDSSKILNELLSAPDNGIPGEVFDNAKCVAVVPSLVKGGFVFGAEHGRGVATCRTSKGWSAPAFFTISGGSWGAQIGGQAVDLVMLFMTQEGAKHLLDAKFNMGGDASVAAGPVGRDASANTDWKFKTGVLTYSRARGLFAGVSLKGAVIRQDDDSTMAIYGKNATFRQILTGVEPAPQDGAAQRFIATVRREKAEAATAH